MVKVSARRNVGERWHSKREWEDSGGKGGNPFGRIALFRTNIGKCNPKFIRSGSGSRSHAL